MPDEAFLAEGISIKDLQKRIRMGDNHAGLLARFIAGTKMLVNAGVAVETLLSEDGIKNVSAAIYALEWSELYYAAETERQNRLKEGYWKRLFRALLNL